MTLRYKLLIPLFFLFLLAFGALIFGVTKEASRLVFQIQQGHLDTDLGSKISVLTDELLEQGSTSPELTQYFFNLRNVDPSVFRIRVFDKEMKIIYEYPLVSESHAVSDTRFLTSAFSGTTGRHWRQVAEDASATSRQYGNFIRGTIPLRDKTGDVRYVAEMDASLQAGVLTSKQSLMYVVELFLLVLVLLLLIGYTLVSHLLLRPIIRLRDATLRIARGDLGAAVTIDSDDEIGSLGVAFNTMAKNTRELYEGLDEKVADKTAELTKQLEENEKSRKAVANLLQDTLILERKAKQQANDIQEAMTQVAKFANSADQERNTYLLLLSNIAEGVVVLNLEHRITVINTAAEELLGAHIDTLNKKVFEENFEFFYNNTIPFPPAFWSDAFLVNVPIVLLQDVVFVRRDGIKTPVYFNVSRIINTRTNVIEGVIVTIRDVSQERALEEARIGFISTASHQLRTPLTSMRWFSEMLLGGDAGAITDEQRHFVERIYQGIDRMIALVNLLLQLARIEAGRVKIDPVPTDLKSTTEAVIAILKVSLDAKKQRIEIVTNPDPLPLIPMDQDVIWQVLQNLLSNAQRYSLEGGIINIAIAVRGDIVEYSIKDNGIGIAHRDREHMFEKFFRADNALRAVPEGSGLGLVLVKTLVEKWGGKIWFESVEHEGTTFHFTVAKTGMRAAEGEVRLLV